MVELSQRQCQRGLQSHHTTGGLGQLPALLFLRVGGVIGSNDINGAVLQSGNDSLDILLGTQRGIDTGQRSLLQNGILSQSKILGTGLTGNGNALLLHPADNIHTLGSRDMADMYGRLSLLCQHGIPHNHQFLRNGRTAFQPQLTGYAALIDRTISNHVGILTVRQQRHSVAAGQNQSITHQIGIVNVVAVIRQRNGTRIFQALKISQFLSAKLLRNRTHRIDIDTAGPGRSLFYIGNLFRIIQYRGCICHTGQTGHTAAGSRHSACKDILLVSQTGIAQMNVHIHQPRRNDQPLGIDHLVGLTFNSLFHLSNLSVFH